jgi:hypothetical protein
MPNMMQQDPRPWPLARHSLSRYTALDGMNTKDVERLDKDQKRM